MKYLLASTVLFTATTANAHYLWIEQPAQGNAIIRFGEYNEGLVEKSPGRMEEMPSIEAFQGNKPLVVSSSANGFLLSAKADREGLTAQEGDYAVKDWRANGIGLAKPMYYARFGPATAPSLGLDIVAASIGGKVQIFFQGKALPAASVSIYAPNGWSKSERSDADGRIAVSTPWRGQYVFEVIHAEKMPGTFNGAVYDVVRHRATLTLVNPSGSATFAIPVAVQDKEVK